MKTIETTEIENNETEKNIKIKIKIGDRHTFLIYKYSTFEHIYTLTPVKFEILEILEIDDFETGWCISYKNLETGDLEYYTLEKINYLLKYYKNYRRELKRI